MVNFNWLTIGAFLLLCGAAIYLSWWVWKSALRQRRRERWPKVTGKVLEHRKRRQGDSVFLEYLAAYEYGGVDYQRISRDVEGGSYTDAFSIRFDELMQKRLDAYPVGGPIPLMLNPDDPARAYYRRGRVWPLTAATRSSTKGWAHPANAAPQAWPRRGPSPFPATAGASPPPAPRR